MKQKLLSMLLAVCLMVWMLPVTALADDPVTENVTWAQILSKIENGIYEGKSTINQDVILWHYDSNSNSIIIHEGTTVSGTDVIDYSVINNGTISGGSFQNQVTNNLSGYINGGEYQEKVSNSGTINGGFFYDKVVNTQYGKIENGTFSDRVENRGGTINEQLVIGDFVNIISSGNNDSGSGSSHTHSFNWVITQEPTETTDGVWEYKCECGHVEAKQPVSLYTVVIRNILNDIQNAPENGTVTIDHATLRCLSDEIVAALLARPDVTVCIDFTDKDVAYSITIPAGQAPTDGQEWYGYYYLGYVYGWTSIVPLAETPARA